jgi:two-component system sensor histidine kinase HydH
MSANQQSAQRQEGQPGLAFVESVRGWFGCGTVFVGRDGKIRAMSPQAARMLGMKEAVSAGRSARALPHPLQRLLDRARTSGGGTLEEEFELAVAGGAGKLLHAKAVRNVTGGDQGVLLLLHDLGPAKELDGRLQQLDRLAAIGTLAASMAHEIKNALVAGKTLVDLLLEKQQDVEVANLVRREQGRIDTIVSRMLRFAAPERRAFAPVQLHHVLDHSLRLVQHELQMGGIALERFFAPGRDAVRGDECELQQAFVNLFLNAMEAMGSQGILKVTTEPAPGSNEISVTVHDTGPGISPELKTKIFEPFFTTKSGGTGLGLAITRRIIEEHHGSITVRSEPGFGTAFLVRLPTITPA